MNFELNTQQVGYYILMIKVIKLEPPNFSGLIGAAHTVIMAVKKAYNQENELLACRPSPEVMIQIFMPGQATMCYG